MKKSYRLFALAALFALGVACWSGLGSPAQEKGKEPEEKKKAKFGVAPPPPLPRWEYKITELEKDDVAAEEDMNLLGKDGWELVGTPTRMSGGGKNGSTSINSKVKLIFKRPRQ